MTIYNGLGQVKLGWKPSVQQYNYLLNTYSGAAAAYSIRKLSSSYTGYALRVRRSADNTSLDIGFDSNGNLDTESLLNFVGYKNNFLVSNVISSANGYGPNGVTFTQNWLTGPDGVTPSNRMSETATNAQHFLSYSIISGTIDSHNVSGYLKKGTGSAAPDRICISVGNSTYGMYAIFNLTTGSIETQVAGTATNFEVKISAEGNGFYRCSVGGKLNYSTNQSIRTSIQFCNNSSSYNPFTTSYVGNINADVQMSYLQWTQGESVLQRYGINGNAGQGYVSIWYDQSGNGRNLTQTTSVIQPRLVNTGVLDTLNGKPSIYNGGSMAAPWRMTVSFGTTISQPTTIFNIGAGAYPGAGGGFIWDGNAAGKSNGLLIQSATQIGVYAGSYIFSNYSSSGSTQRLIFAKYNGASSSLAVNLGTATNGNAGTQSITGININSSQTGAGGTPGSNHQEFILWNADKTTDRTGISNNINTYFGTY